MLVWRLRGLRSFASLNDLHTIQTHGKPSDLNTQRPSLQHQREALKTSAPIKEFKKKIDKTPEDLEGERLRQKDKEFESMVRGYFANENAAFDPQNYTRVEKTQRLTRALRLNSVFDFSPKKSPQNLSADYNNYEKFKMNYSFFNTRQDEDKWDTGLTMKKKAITDYITGLTPDGTYREGHEFEAQQSERENKQPKNPEAAAEQLLEENSEFVQDDEELGPDDISGRLSPHAREEMYRLYESGWSVKDLAYRYGILPSRVKAIVWCRRHFYEEVKPRVDPITWKLGVEREFLYASLFPFLDFGIDLSMMSVLEQGVPSIQLTQSHLDVNPSPAILEKIKRKMETIKPLRRKAVERTVVGTGPHAYKVKDLITAYGNGRHTVSEMFKRVCMWSHSKPHWLPQGVQARLSKGPRIASQGYRMGGNQR